MVVNRSRLEFSVPVQLGEKATRLGTATATCDKSFFFQTLSHYLLVNHHGSAITRIVIYKIENFEFCTARYRAVRIFRKKSRNASLLISIQNSYLQR